MGSALSDLFIPPEDLAHDGRGFFQLLCLGGAYSYVLGIGGMLIKDGSELLLLVPALANIVGAIILPVLGAVPDGAIVLFSGLGNATNAQKQLVVGIGALSGSTVMMLTVLWGLSMFAGRVDFDENGKGTYKKPEDLLLEPVAPTDPLQLSMTDKKDSNTNQTTTEEREWSKLTKPFFETGVNVSPAIKHAGIVMVITMIPLAIIQIPAAIAKCSLTDETSDCKTPKAAAIVAAIVAVILFFGYLIDQYMRAATDIVQQQRIRRSQEKSLAMHIMSARAMFFQDYYQETKPSALLPGGKRHQGKSLSADEQSRLLLDSPQQQQQQRQPGKGGGSEPAEPLLKPDRKKKFEHFVRKLFIKYDKNISGHIEKVDLIVLLKDLGEPTTQESVDRYMKQADRDQDGKISFQDFLDIMLEAKKQTEQEAAVPRSSPLNLSTSFEHRHPASPESSSALHRSATAPADLTIESPIMHSINSNNNNSDSDQQQQQQPSGGNNIHHPHGRPSAVAVVSPTNREEKTNASDSAAAAAATDNLEGSQRKKAGGAGGAGGGKQNYKVHHRHDSYGEAGMLQHSGSTTYGGVEFVPARAESESSSDSDVEMPEDLAKLPPEEQRKRVLIRAAWMLSLGTALVIFFSDPMVDILHELGERTNISPFYVAFIIAPLVSSSPEIIASYSYAAKKTITSASISFATLLGTVAMNNTFCLAIFLILVVMRDLKWIFTAEVSSMFFVEIVLLLVCLYNGSSFRSKWIIFVALLLPASLVLVIVMESAGLD